MDTSRSLCPNRSLVRWIAALLLTAPGLAFAAATSTSIFTAPTTPTLRINEVLAANTRIANGGTFPDIIELYNAGTAAVDLSGKSLTDDPLVPRKYVFPNGTSLAAGAYLAVYADLNSSAPGLHTGFSLDAEGDQVRLHDSPANAGALIDSLTFGFQVPDHSIARTGGASNIWTITVPTPGAANNTPAPLGNLDDLKINEWAGKIVFRLDHDLIELFNPGALPVAVTGVRLTDDIARPTRFVFPSLSFIAPGGFMTLFGADFGFGLDGDTDPIFLLGENNATIDQVTLNAQPTDFSTGRNPDGSATQSNFAVPTPGMSNQTAVPATYQSLLNNLRITEVMFQPAADNNAGDYEYVELQNIGATPLDLSGVRFTNGIDYTFPAGTTLAGGAHMVVARSRSTFTSRYPAAASALAPGAFTGALDNTGETLALTLPAPWYVHILRFRFESTWFASTAGGGRSLVVATPSTTPARNWFEQTTWRASAAVNGSPGVADPGTPGPGTSASRLLNLSTRGLSLTGSDQLIPGFVITGSGSKRLLIRAIGPTLGSFGVQGTLADPQLTLKRFDTTTSAYVDVRTNDNWGTPASEVATIASVTTSVGGFALANGSADAAMVVDLPAGQYSAVAGGANNGTGVALVELYDSTASSDARLINIATRGFVGTGGDVLISGFVISSEGPKTLLIRAIGPTLASFGVPGALANPQLSISGRATGATSDSVVATNNDWSTDAGAATTAATATQVGAFALAAGSLDAALVVTLPPGNYTAQASGVGNTTGTALVEIYVVP
ncbi:MAG: lamin tail domain-containing protein [Verrucomicrobiota bacterium]